MRMNFARGHVARLLALSLPCSFALAALGGAARAQEPGIVVLVDEIAGANIYIRAGTDDGVTLNDTLAVYDESGEHYLGSLLVLSATRSRAVVTFVADPFSLTRGTTVLVALSGPPPTMVSPGETTTESANRSTRSPRYTPEVNGRLSLQFNALESTTRWLSNEEVEIDRNFATPAIGLRMVVSHLPGDIEFTTNLRGAYRYSSDDLVDPSQSVRVYQLSLTKSFASIPLQLQAGRFYSRYETYSGYWDGLLLHYGERGIGIGVIAGYQPERTNESFSTEAPKYTAFVDFNRVGAVASYHTDLSFHHAEPSSDMARQTFMGWSQRLVVGRARLASDLQVDRDSGTGTWTISRLHAAGSIPLAGRLSLHARYSLDEPRFVYNALGLPTYRRQQGSAGLGYWARRGSFNLDVTANKMDDADVAYALSTSFSLPETRMLGIGLHGAASYWSLEDTKAINLMGGLDRRFGAVQVHASYQVYNTERLTNRFLTRNVDFGLVFPLARRWYSTVQGRLQRGENQNANSIFVNLWMSF